MSDGDDPSPAERARELAVQLRVLRIRERTANFEDREAIRRAINEREAELERLEPEAEHAADAGPDPDVD
jgi:hypothetical protein